MAEATLTTETEVVTPPNDAAVLPPESPAESVPAPENVEAPANDEPSVVDAILDSIGNAVAKDAGDDGKNAAPDGVVPYQPTEEQIRAAERARVNAENRAAGLRAVIMEDAPTTLWRELSGELTDEKRQVLIDQINRIKGAYDPLLQRAVEVDTNYAPQVRTQALKEAEDWTLQNLGEAVKAELGDAAYKAFTETRHGSWQDVGKFFTKEARKGWVSKETLNATLKTEFDKFEQQLKDRGAQGIVTTSLAQLKGGTGPEVPPARNGSGSRYTSTAANDKAFNDGLITREVWKSNDDRLRDSSRS